MKILKLIFTYLIIIYTTISIFTISLASMSNGVYVWSNISDSSVETNASLGDDLKLESGSAILIETNSGQILYEHNSNEELRPASVTKIMSILLIMEAIENELISLDDLVPVSSSAAGMGGSQIWLNTTETLTVHELLKAVIIVSANDACYALGELVGGTMESFVSMMNSKAAELGMNNTTFKNCHGIDEDGHVTSSYDIALMSRELLVNYPEITKYTTIWTDTLRNGESELVNTNKLIRNYNGATGLKTGSTSLALYNLSASATREDLSLIAVIMKAPTTAVRFSEATTLLDYGFSNYEYITLANQNDILTNITVEKGIDTSVNLIIEDNVGFVALKGSSKNVEHSVRISENISAPIEKNQIIRRNYFYH